MTPANNAQPADQSGALEQENRALKISNDALKEENKQLKLELHVLRDRISLMLRKMYGRSSEQLDDKQLLLLLEGGSEGPKKPEASQSGSAALEAEIKKVEANKPAKNREDRQPRIPENLPVSERIEITPDEVLAEPEAFTFVDSVESEQLDMEPAKFHKRVIVRHRFKRKEAPEQPPIIAELPVLKLGCKAAPGLLAYIITGKYCDHLPLYRQEQIFANRHGIKLSRQTMCRWLADVAQVFNPIYELMHQELLLQKYLQCDETVIKYLKPGSGKAQQGYLWTITSPGVDTVYMWHTGRSAECFDQVVPKGFKGKIGCDAFSVYSSAKKKRINKLQLAACWAHIRRKFFEAKGQAPLQARSVLLLIARLYLIERRLRKRRAGPSLREAVRSAESQPIIQRIRKLLDLWEQKGRFTPQSAMGKAIAYTRALGDNVAVYADDGLVEIDNNRVENAIRPTAIGKKNWLFIGDETAGQTSAILFTLVEACRQRGINPYEYFKDVLTRLPTLKTSDYAKLTPLEWYNAKHGIVVRRKVVAPTKAVPQAAA